MKEEPEVVKDETPQPSLPKRKQRGSFPLGALILIFVGVVLLLNNFGVLPWSVWGEIWRFWPVLLILSGIQLLLDGSWWYKALIFILGLLILVFAFAIILLSPNPSALQDLVNTWGSFDNQPYLNLEGVN